MVVGVEDQGPVDEAWHSCRVRSTARSFEGGTVSPPAPLAAPASSHAPPLKRPTQSDATPFHRPAIGEPTPREVKLLVAGPDESALRRWNVVPRRTPIPSAPMPFQFPTTGTSVARP